MKMRKLLLLGMTVLMSNVAMAQTALTTKNAKVVPGYDTQSDATVSFEVPATIGGWQMVLSLPEGLSLESDANGELSVGGTKATATVFSGVAASSLHKNHQIIGGTTTEGDVLLVCVPTAKEEAIGTSGSLCTIKLKASADYKGGAVTIKEFIASDPQGAKTYSTKDVAFNVVALKGDVNGDGIVTVADNTAVYNVISETDTTYKSTSDVNGDTIVTVADVTAITNEISL